MLHAHQAWSGTSLRLIVYGDDHMVTNAAGCDNPSRKGSKRGAGSIVLLTTLAVPASQQTNRERDVSGWRPIETAPKDGTTILVFGHPESIELVRYTRAAVYSAAWDNIDEAFCLSGGTWLGPFIEPSHWMPIPEPPKTK